MLDYFDEIAEFFDEESQTTLHDLFDSVDFKLKKNQYHFENIKKIMERTSEFDSDSVFERLHLPVYYEMESFLISLRSNVDVFLHLIVYCFDLDLEQQDVNLYHVYRHPRLPKTVKNIFERYTRPFDNPTWNFIYTSRNEIVHERSINQVLPLNIDFFNFKQVSIFFEYEGADREMISFFGQCLRFLETFCSQLFQAIRLALKNAP